VLETCKFAGRGSVLPPFSSNCFQLYPDRVRETPDGDGRAVWTLGELVNVMVDDGDEAAEGIMDGGGISPDWR
jgi:hypothetical protein